MVMQALAGFGLNFLGNSLNQMMSENANRRLQENQARLNYEYAEKAARNNATWNRAGLEDAGYNPMLAVQNATSGANSSWASGAHADSLDTHAGTDMIANAQSFQRLNNETHTAETTADLNEASAQKERALATKQELENPYVEPRQRAELGKLSAETANINRATEHFEAIEHNMEVMQRLQEMGINLNYASSIYASDKAYNASTYGSDKYLEGVTKSLPPKWASTLGGILGTSVGAGLGVYGAIRGSKSFKKKGFNYGGYYPYSIP